MANGYERIILKLSGQSLAGRAGQGYDPDTLAGIASELLELQADGCQVGVVIGGGNLFRGASTIAREMERTTADAMGMLATLMNGLALQTVFEGLGGRATVFSAVQAGAFAEVFSRRSALLAFARGELVILAGGTGNPFFTTDSAAALRAAELDADALLKATRVDGVYDRDPEHHAGAVRFDRLTYDEVIARRLGVMDTTAFTLCRDHGIPIIVFDLHTPGNILRAVRGEPIGSLITG